MLINDFNIEKIANSGQCFRWNKTEQGSYIGVIYGRVCEVIQNENEIYFNGIDEEEIIEDYFDLKRDYKKIKEIYKDDKILEKAIEYSNGIRILQQDKFETLISFIISANNNIPRIKKSVEKISEKFGKKITYNRKVYHAFPSPQELKCATLEELKDCGVGFRDKYIKEAVESITTGKLNLEEISKLEIGDCKKKLIEIKGVGNKVADCVMLYSMEKIEAFPIDVWIKRIIEEAYLKREASIKEIGEFAKNKFPYLPGIVQQYLFYYYRENNLRKY